MELQTSRIISFGIWVHSLSIAALNSLIVAGFVLLTLSSTYPHKKSPEVRGLVNVGGIQYYLFAQSICSADFRQNRLSHQDGSGEVLHLAGNKTSHLQIAHKHVAFERKFE